MIQGYRGFIALSIFILLLPTILPAQYALPYARGIGMGGTGVSYANGVDALGVNPAGIGFDKEKRFSISVYPFGTFLGTDFLDYATYTKYFTGVDDGTGKRVPYHLTEADKQSLLSSISGDAGHIAANAALKQYAFTVKTGIGSFGLHMEDHFEMNLALPKQFAEFLFNGNPPGSVYDFSALRAATMWTRGYGLTYARQFALPGVKSLSVGVTGKILQGFEYVEVGSFNTRLATDPDSFVVTGHANMSMRYAATEFFDTWMEMLGGKRHMPVSTLYPAPVGHGFGMDIGAIMELQGGLTLAASLIDFNSSVTWNRNARVIETDGDFRVNDLTGGAVQDSLDAILNGKERSVSSFTTPVPGRLMLGANLELPRLLGKSDRFLCAASITARFNTLPGSLPAPFLGVGAEWEYIPSVPIRAGLAFGGYRSPLFSAGIGFHIQNFAIDMSVDNLTRLLGSNASDLSFGFGFRVDFDSFK